MHNNGIYVGGDLTVNHGSVSNAAAADHSRQHRSGIDVLVIAALKEEYDAAQAVAGGSQWRDHGVGGSEPYTTGTYRTATGETISVALARPIQMGGRSVGSITTTLANKLRPACLAMCGVCAGNPRSTAPGDVVVASPAYEWDEGKHTGDAFAGDYQQFPQDARWVRAAQDFDPAGLPAHGVATDREAEVWLLERLYKDQDPRTHPARGRYFPHSTWRTQLERLEGAGLITWRDARWTLTGAGRDRIQRTLYVDVEGPDRLPFGVFAGPMASGSPVMADRRIWDRLEIAHRKTLALDMEAATIATVAHERQIPHWLVAKGVMDHGGLDKDDRFKPFAARASAEVLFALLGVLIPGAASTADAIPGRVRLA